MKKSDEALPAKKRRASRKYPYIVVKMPNGPLSQAFLSNLMFSQIFRVPIVTRYTFETLLRAIYCTLKSANLASTGQKLQTFFL